MMDFQASFSVSNAMSGPQIGVFIVGFFDRRSDGRAVSMAYVLGMIAAMGLWTWNKIEDPNRGYFLSTNTSQYGCDAFNQGHQTFRVRPQITAYDPHYGNPEAPWIAR